MKKAYLVLEDGHIFEGYSFGAQKATCGELVFTTGVTGYIENLTDPNFYGQIVLQTFPLIGNYGIIPEDFEGKPCLSGYVVREWCDTPSNFRSEYDIDKYLCEQGIPGICGIDTREITKIIRECGTMNARICYELPADAEELKNYSLSCAVASTVEDVAEEFAPCGEEKYQVTVINYGKYASIVRELCGRGCRVTLVPYTYDADKLSELPCDAIVLSDGPGDPAENVEAIETVKRLLGKYPIFAVGLGHQLLALACGGVTFKLKYGHRGANQPVREIEGTRTYITNQNHGYAVAPNSITNGNITFVNANDGTCEGLEYPELSAFSVQFHPEYCTGPVNAAFLYEKFIAMMGGKDHAAE